MSEPQPGWYPDPTDQRRWRWWDGVVWTDQVGEGGRQQTSPLAAAPRKRRVPTWVWVLVVVLAFPVLLALWPLLGVAALAVVVTGVVAIATRSRTWLRFGSTGAAVAAIVVAAFVVAGTGGLAVVALTSAPMTVTVAEPAPLLQPVDEPRSSSAPIAEPTSSVPPAQASATPRATAKPTPTPTPKPTPTPVTRVSEVAVASAIPFGRTSVEDNGLPRGQSRIDVAGADGEKVSVFRVTTVDGVETSRSLLRESVIREAVTEVSVVGTYDPPPPAAELPGSDGCHPSYVDACVPIDSDVDCAGGKGNGPSYFDGVARVVGPDVYDLDRDGDGWACNG